MMMSDKEIKHLSRCCSACSIGKRCLKQGEEDVQHLVSNERGSDRGSIVDERQGSEEFRRVVGFSSIAGRIEGTKSGSISGPTSGSSMTPGINVFCKSTIINWKESAVLQRKS